MRVETIESLDDPRVRAYRNVRDPELRRDDGLFLAEGRLNVLRLVEGPRFRVHSLFVTPTALSGLGDALGNLSDEASVYVAAQPILNGVVGYDLHRGCIAAGLRGEPAGFESLVAPSQEPSLLVALEHLTNPDNVGAVFRNAMAFGADGALLCPRTSDPLYRKAIRVSMGATLQLPFARFEAWPAGLEKLRAADYRIIALHPSAAREIRELDLATPGVPARLVLVLGSEGPGLASETRALAHDEARIAMAPGMESLNVATAAAIALHHFAGARSAAE